MDTRSKLAPEKYALKVSAKSLMSFYRRTVTALALLATIAFAAVISWLTLTPQDLPKVDDLPVDKLAHIAAFAALIMPSAVLRPRFLWWTLPLATLLGLGIEMIQPYVGRSQEWIDVAADLIGLITGTSLGLMLRRFLKSRVFPDH